MPSKSAPLLRPFAVVAALCAAGLLLAGCAGSSTPKASASAASPTASAAASLACVGAGKASDAVKVSGAFDATPTVSFDAPLEPASTEKSVVTAGKGAKAQQGTELQVAYTLFDAKTGKKAISEGYGAGKGVAVTVDAQALLTGLATALDCAQAGSRIVTAIPAADAFGSTGLTSKGIGKNDPVVFVVDVLSITPTKADGVVQPLPSGFPSVSVAASGQPTVRIPATAAPTTLRIADRERGTGATVASGDTVTVQYQGVIWRTGTVFDQSWGRSPASFATNQVVKGFAAALVGHRVGSQVVAIIPPSDGYGKSGNAQAGIKGTDTMVFVIDILSATKAG